MKKIIFVFIMAFATITLMAQQTDELTETLDSLVITDIDYGFVRAKFNYGYDSNKRLNQVVFSKVEEYSTDLHYYEKQNYTYDDYGRCLSYTHFIWENGWIVDRKTDSTFNAMGECVFLRNYSYSSYFSNYEKGNTPTKTGTARNEGFMTHTLPTRFGNHTTASLGNMTIWATACNKSIIFPMATNGISAPRGFTHTMTGITSCFRKSTIGTTIRNNGF